LFRSDHEQVSNFSQDFGSRPETWGVDAIVIYQKYLQIVLVTSIG